MKSLSRHILQQIVESSSQGILLIDARSADLKITYANPAFEALSGCAAAQLEGTRWMSLLADDDDNPELAKVRRAIGSADPCEVTLPYSRKDGTTWLAAVSLRPLSSVRGDTRYFLCQHESASSANAPPASMQVGLLQRVLGQARQKIVSLDRIDPISGLLRYEHFVPLLRRDLNVARREGRSLAALVFEIVELETYRQTFGVNAADSCVRMVGAQIAGAFRRAGDLCARLDETAFVVTIRNQDAREIESLAQRVADKVRNLGLHNPRAQSGRYLSIRSALLVVDVDDEDAEGLVARAKAQLMQGRTQLQQPA